MPREAGRSWPTMARTMQMKTSPQRRPPRKGSSLPQETSTYYDYRTPYGRVTIGVRNGAVYTVSLGRIGLEGTRKPCELSNVCANELLEYFSGKRRTFDIPLSPFGSAFQLEVWDTVQNIPYGQTRTMAEVAQMIGRPSSFRMIGTAVRRNPIIVIIPAHRVVGANGKVTGVDAQSRIRAALIQMEQSRQFPG